jgi:putative ABC transport system permease protein
MVNQKMAGLVFKDENPIGQHISFVFITGQPPLEIIGVVADENVVSLDAQPNPVVYFPYSQDLESSRFMTMVVRTSSAPAMIAGAVRNEMRAVDPELPVFNVRTMDELISNSPFTFQRRYPAFLIGVFAVIALLLAAVGIYGLMSYTVAQRTNEIGIRTALGANRGDIIKLLLGRGLGLTVVGIVIGVGAAFALTRFLSNLLFGVAATDPGVFVLIVSMLIAVSFLACILPAIKATRIDPMLALRNE